MRNNLIVILFGTFFYKYVRYILYYIYYRVLKRLKVMIVLPLNLKEVERFPNLK